MGVALGQRRYIPRAPRNTLKDIVEAHLEELERVYDDRFRNQYGPLHPRVIDLYQRFLRCGDFHFGSIRLHCEDCGHERLLPYSCKARGLCPSCGKRRAIEWAERMVEEVLPDVPYAPLVFTIPKILRPAFLFWPELYGDFCRAAYRVTKPVNLASVRPRLALLPVGRYHPGLGRDHQLVTGVEFLAIGAAGSPAKVAPLSLLVDLTRGG